MRQRQLRSPPAPGLGRRPRSQTCRGGRGSAQRPATTGGIGQRELVPPGGMEGSFEIERDGAVSPCSITSRTGDIQSFDAGASFVQPPSATPRNMGN